LSLAFGRSRFSKTVARDSFFEIRFGRFFRFVLAEMETGPDRFSGLLTTLDDPAPPRMGPRFS
jgi:hypothetical protein